MRKSNPSPYPQGTGGRLLSLDVLRGLTVAGMILVNNGYGESFGMLRHSRWNGMTPCDLVFPFFLFIMGVSCYLSLSKTHFTATRPVVWKVVKRTLLLFAIGLAINWFDLAARGDILCFDHLRLWAVMQRIALCYFFVSLFALFVSHRYTLPVAAVLLAAYTVVLLVGNGYAEDAGVNVLAQADIRLFGYAHLYHKSPVDPEGLVGTVSGVAHVLLGFYCGLLIKQRETAGQKALAVFSVGTVCVVMGYLLTYSLPLNKRIWSPSYVLVTCGLAALMLALFINVERDPSPRQHALLRLPARFCRVFGVNALALYVGSELLAILFARFGISDALYQALHALIPAPKCASLAYALSFVALNFLPGYVLWRKKIFIKL